jgi:hemoglobin
MDAQRAKQKGFLTFAFGGPNAYTGKDMRTAHSKLKLTEEHFNAVMENLGATLKELGIPDELIGEAAAVALSVKNEVLNR